MQSNDTRQMQRQIEEMQKKHEELLMRVEMQKRDTQADIDHAVASAVEEAIRQVQSSPPSAPAATTTILPFPPSVREAPRLGSRPQRTSPRGPCRASATSVYAPSTCNTLSRRTLSRPATSAGVSGSPRKLVRFGPAAYKPEFESGKSGAVSNQHGDIAAIRWKPTQIATSRCERDLERLRAELKTTQQRLEDAEKRAYGASKALREGLGPAKRRAREAELTLDAVRASADRSQKEQEAKHALHIEALKAHYEAAQQREGDAWREKCKALVNEMADKVECREIRIAELLATLGIEERAAIHLQSAERRRKALQQFEKSKAATLRIQSGGRRRSAQQNYDHHRLAAARIQGAGRGYLHRRRMVDLSLAARTVQRLWRKHYAKVAFLRAIEMARLRRRQTMRSTIGITGSGLIAM